MYSSLEGLKSVFFSLYHLSLLHSHRKQTTSAPSCRVLLFVLDQGPRAKSACPFVTFYPWCTLMILSLTVWTIVCSSSDLTQMCTRTNVYVCAVKSGNRRKIWPPDSFRGQRAPSQGGGGHICAPIMSTNAICRGQRLLLLVLENVSYLKNPALFFFLPWSVFVF